MAEQTNPEGKDNKKIGGIPDKKQDLEDAEDIENSVSATAKKSNSINDLDDAEDIENSVSTTAKKSSSINDLEDAEDIENSVSATAKKSNSINDLEDIENSVSTTAKKSNSINDLEDAEDIENSVSTTAKKSNSINDLEDAEDIENSVSTTAKKPLSINDLVMPASIEKKYVELNGKFYGKDSKHLIFEDKGASIRTSTTDPKEIQDIVDYTKAKQWDSLKLSGSKEFRREVWLQAESQGIKTNGYTPNKNDITTLNILTDERSKNTVSELGTKYNEREQQTEKLSNLHTAATQKIDENLTVMNSLHGTTKSESEVKMLAYWRGITAEKNSNLSPKAVENVLADFDRSTHDQEFVDSLTTTESEVTQGKEKQAGRSKDKQAGYSKDKLGGASL